MKILLSNDDGYQAEGLKFLESYFCQKGHDVYVVAPHIEQSGKSHSVTFQDSIRLYAHFDKTWVLEGTPADCVNLGLIGILPVKPDLVVSGINHGYNVGVDIIYSGTVAAARQGAIAGIPSIALSSGVVQANEIDIGAPSHYINYEIIESFLDKNLLSLIDAAKNRHIININFPNITTEQLKGSLRTIPSLKNRYSDQLITFQAPHQGCYYWIKGELCQGNEEEDDDTDIEAIRNGYISVSALHLIPSDSGIKIDLR